jgi:hypothetical protein
MERLQRCIEALDGEMRELDREITQAAKCTRWHAV